MHQHEAHYLVTSRNYITVVVIPRVAVGLATELQKLLKEIQHKFITDIWSTDISSGCLLSLTAHWFSDSFEKRTAILNQFIGGLLCEY